MKWHKRGKCYIRRANGRERSRTLVVGVKLALYRREGVRHYVLVPHGAPLCALVVGRTKQAIRIACTRAWLRAGAEQEQRWREGYIEADMTEELLEDVACEP